MQWRQAIGTLRCEKQACVGGKLTPYATSGLSKYGPYAQHKTFCNGGIMPFKGICDKTPCNDKKYCPDGKYCDKINQVCTKMMVLHVDKMSKSAGILLVKRASCFKGKCSIFKVPPLSPPHYKHPLSTCFMRCPLTHLPCHTNPASLGSASTFVRVSGPAPSTTIASSTPSHTPEVA